MWHVSEIQGSLFLMSFATQVGVAYQNCSRTLRLTALSIVYLLT
jgi:hypothetical protein